MFKTLLTMTHNNEYETITMAPWTCRQVLSGIERLAQEHRVHLAYVNPGNTSRTCPQCGTATKENRAGENFHCVRYNYTADADLSEQ